MTTTADSAGTYISILAGATIVSIATLGYFLVDAHKKLTANGTEISNLSLSLESTRRSLESVESASKEHKNQLAILRVALAQSSNVKLDKSGAIVTRKGSKSDGIVLR